MWVAMLTTDYYNSAVLVLHQFWSWSTLRHYSLNCKYRSWTTTVPPLNVSYFKLELYCMAWICVQAIELSLIIIRIRIQILLNSFFFYLVLYIRLSHQTLHPGTLEKHESAERINTFSVNDLVCQLTRFEKRNGRERGKINEDDSEVLLSGVSGGRCSYGN